MTTLEAKIASSTKTLPETFDYKLCKNFGIIATQKKQKKKKSFFCITCSPLPQFNIHRKKQRDMVTLKPSTIKITEMVHNEGKVIEEVVHAQQPQREEGAAIIMTESQRQIPTATNSCCN